MCDCDEVSENRRVEVKEQKDGRVHYEICLENGDFFYTESGYNSYTKKMEWGIGVKGTTIYDPYAYWCEKGEPVVWTMPEIGFDEGNSYGAKRFVWLPRQDQIQAMLQPIELYELLDICGDGMGIMWMAVCEYADSFEQLWLAFYMLEKYSKIWNGEKWIKS